MKEYVISDTHFSHYNIIKYCDRPFKDISEMNEHIINSWNSIVTNDDIVYHLGDVGFGNKEVLSDFVHKLNGHKILILGNHDYSRGIGFWEDVGFELAYKCKQIQKNNSTENIILSHYPVQCDDNVLNIHGHIHNIPLDKDRQGKELNKNNHICVSVEMIDYKPIEINKIIRRWRENMKDKSKK